MHTGTASAGMSRRAFHAWMAALAGGAVFGPSALLRSARGQDGTGLAMAEVAPGFRVITGQGGNTLVAIGDGGSVLVDCKTQGNGEALRGLAQSAGVPVAAVINTHHHGDHTGGNPAFTKDLPVYAHAKCGPRVRAQVAGRGDNPAAWLPTREAGPDTVVEAAGVRARLRHSGAGHTDNDLFVFFEDSNVLHTGDLVFHGLHPFVDRPAGADTSGWIAACEAMLAVCDDRTVVVPGHGEVGDRRAIEGQIGYWNAVRDAVGDVVGRGGARDEASGLVLPIFEGMGFERLREGAMGAVYDELRELRGE